MNILFIGFVALLLVALAGWAIAELKGRMGDYQNDAEEAEELAAFVKAGGYTEKTIYDSQKNCFRRARVREGLDCCRQEVVV